jgi:uncharacterized RDD family membrane protein YckC
VTEVEAGRSRARAVLAPPTGPVVTSRAEVAMIEPQQEINPYAPPKADLEGAPARALEAELASRWQRLGAALIDGFAAAIAGLPMSLGRSAMTRYNLLGNPFQHWHLGDLRGIVGATLVVGLMVVQWYLVATGGQTIGKRLVGTRITRLDGSAVGFKSGVMLRGWLPMLIAWIPGVGPIFALVDSVAIFGSDKRCLHDRIAGTKVVRAEFTRAPANG